MAPSPDLMTTGEVAATFNVGTSTVRRWHEKGLLVAIELPSKQLRFRRSDVEALLAPAERAS